MESIDMSEEQTIVQQCFAEIGKKFEGIVNKFKRHEAPYDTEIEYLQSSGIQVIDTGIAPFSNLKVTVTGLFPMKFPSSAFGCRYSGKVGCFGFLSMETASKIRIDLGTTNSSSTYPQRWEATNKDLTSITIDAKNKVAQAITIDGQTLSHTYSSVSMTFQTLPTIKVFQYDLNESSTFGNNMRIATLQMWNNEELFHDFISVRKGTIGYLYDKISNQLFGNVGTGDFVLGADKS